VEEQLGKAQELATEVSSKVEGAAANLLGKGQRWTPLPPPAGLPRAGQPSESGRKIASRCARKRGNGTGRRA